MQIVLATEDGDRELDVVVHDPEATVADLVTALVALVARGEDDRRGEPASTDGATTRTGDLGDGEADRPDLGFDLEAEDGVVPPTRRLDRSGIRSGSSLRLVPADRGGTGGDGGHQQPPPWERGPALGGPGPLAGADRAPEGRPGTVGDDVPWAPRRTPTGRGAGSPGRVAAPRTTAGGRALPVGLDGQPTEVAVVGGLDAGARMPIGPGRWRLGRGRPVASEARPPPAGDRHLHLGHGTVSAHHADVEVAGDGTVTVADAGSLNGTWVAGRPAVGPTPLASGRFARLGAVQVAVRAAAADDRATMPSGPVPGGATVPFNRPPRPTPAGAPEPVEGPEPPGEATTPSAVGIMAVVAPLVLGGTLVVLTGQLAYSLFLLLSPLVVLGNAVDARRRGRRARRRDEARYRRQLADLVRDLGGLAEGERARREDEVPDPAELLRRISTPSTRLWERRPGHPDWLLLRAGIGTDRWDPPVLGDDRSRPPEVGSAVAAAGLLVDAPVPVDLSGGGVVGVVGPRGAALAVARSLLLQAAALHGPADLRAVVLTGPGRGPDWDWAKWLPHLHDPGGSARRLVATTRDAADALGRALLEATEGDRRGRSPGGNAGSGPTTLVVVDDEALTGGRRSPVRAVLRGGAGPVAGVVVAGAEDRLPASCTAVIEVVDDDGTARVHRLREGGQVDDVLATGVSEATARRAARGLARHDDPELGELGSGLPPVVALLPLLGLEAEAGAIAARWAAGGDDPDPATPVGVAEDGVLVVDLLRDGPHGLVAGTTGAGKSELLRTLVVGLAVGSSPDHLTFVLVDFKGGSAFDRCALLPHTVGLVTDLDPHLAARALRCLEAEVRHRERVLRQAGASDLTAYRRLPPRDRPVLPRLVVVVDEFATLRSELPDFVESLVGLAQRGRSLGIHLVLATQRPSGAVSEDIRANTDLRIALRVQDAADSHDVVDGPEAARIGRGQPGRALARFGPGEVVRMQTALCTGPRRDHGIAVSVRPFALDLDLPIGGGGPAGRGGGRERDASDLALLVEACRRAHAASGRPLPRRPWPDPLPAEVDLAAVAEVAATAEMATGPFGAPGRILPFALADLPDQQAQGAAGWVPADGNLLLAGLPGSGTTTALAVLALAAAGTTPPDALHVYALDLGRGELEVLAGLPHVGAVVGAADRERQARLVSWLEAELERRRGLPSPRHEPRVLVLVDGLGAFRTEWDDTAAVLDGFDRVFAEGPPLGLHLAVATDRILALPAPLRSLVRQELLFHLADGLDYAPTGWRVGELPVFRPGRALEAEGGREVQVARPRAGLAAAVAAVAAMADRHRRPLRPPAAIGVLPGAVALAQLQPGVRLDALPRHLPLGIGEASLAPVGLTLYEGEHALVAGPARSGRTTVLAVAGAVAHRAGWRTVVVAGPRSALGARGELGPRLHPSAVAEDLPPLLGSAEGPDRPLLLLVDDLEAVDPDGSTMPSILERPDVVVVAAGRAEALRGLYSHWVRALRADRVGVLLRPDVDLDGDLLGVRLPRRSVTALGPGRGYLCNGGEVELVQIAQTDRPLG